GFLKRIKAGKTHATKLAVTSVGSALTASALTTMAGFLAMLFGISPSSKIQGFVLSTGIFYAFIATVIVLPCLLVAYKKLVYSDMDKIIFKLSDEEKKEKTEKGPLFYLASMQVAKPKTILLVFFVLTVLIVPGMTQLWMDTSNDNWIPPNDPVMAAMDEISSKFGGLDSQNFLLQITPDADKKSVKDLRDPRVMRKLAELDKAMEKHQDVSSFRTPADILMAANNGKVPQDIEQIKNIINADEQARNYFNKDFTVMKLTAIGDGFGGGNPNEAPTDIYFEWLNEAESVSFPEGVFYQAQGGIRSDMEIDNLLAVDTMKTTGIGFLFVFLIALLIYRSWVTGMLAILPIIFAIIWTLGIMGWTNLPFTVLTSGMMAIVMGMGIDFSIHLIHNTKSMLKKGKDIAESVTSAVTSTGEAMSVTTLTTVVGFSSLLLATLLATKRLGLTLAIAVFSAFVICMLIVPATLVIEHNFKKRKKLRGK
ncbi:MMPL family transporter, partial [Candidatus Woesearchaeota archaeon]|nr:MMPL family transporter [Candidatus Woesearchaeota archaeon]